MRTWLNVRGEHINLAMVTSIIELDRDAGLIGYMIRHGSQITSIEVPAEIETKVKPNRESEDYKLYRVIIIIRNYLYDRTLQDMSGGSRREDDY